jgi:hypothetical protein
MTVLLEQKLPECNNKQKADDFCVSFVTTSNGNKGPRKRLATALSKIPRNRSDLAPGYARYVRSERRTYSGHNLKVY